MKINLKLSKITFPAILALFISGCGPVFETTYYYTPPTSPAGMDCIVYCNKLRTSCEQKEVDLSNSCSTRADREYRYCEDRRRVALEICSRQFKYNSKEYNDCLKARDAYYSCSKEDCKPNLKVCEGPFNTCYSSCGGIVQEGQVCVSGCDQLAK